MKQKRLFMPVIAVIFLLLVSSVFLLQQGSYSTFSADAVAIKSPGTGTVFDKNEQVIMMITFSPSAGKEIDPVCTAWQVTVSSAAGLQEAGLELNAGYTYQFTKTFYFDPSVTGRHVIRAAMLIKERSTSVSTTTTVYDGGGGVVPPVFDLTAGDRETEYYNVLEFNVIDSSVTTSEEPLDTYFTYVITTNIITQSAPGFTFAIFLIPLLAVALLRKPRKDGEENQ